MSIHYCSAAAAVLLLATTVWAQSAADGSSSSTDDSASSAPSVTDAFITAHGTLGGIAFLALFPLGAILIRVASFTGLVWVHAAIQVVAYMIHIAGAGMGIHIALVQDELNNAHPIIGLVLLSVIFFQPFGGYIHHLMFKRNQSRNAVSYVHIWIGRGAILLGIINGGLGLQLAGATNGAYIAYGVCAGVVAVAYLAIIIFSEVKRTRVKSSVNHKTTTDSSSPSSIRVADDKTEQATFRGRA